ncbi:hypothetical protein AMTRI_Chr12g272340 [Amborella trichopoda]
MASIFQLFILLFICVRTISGAGKPLRGASNTRNALMDFKSGVAMDPFSSLSNWNTTIPVCKWTGITCRKSGWNVKVIQLDLNGKSLHGVISPSICSLSSLYVLDLSGNYFEGHIPGEIGSLLRLQQLSLAENMLEGSIPVQLGSVTGLEYLDLGTNSLSGEIPPSLFYNCTSLQYVDLSNNSLSGEIGFFRLPELRFLLLWSNRLVGNLPESLTNSSKLEWVDLESNFLVGELPTSIVRAMNHLQFLHLSYNKFVSHENNTNLRPFFSSLTQCLNLQELELAGNRLGGEVPMDIGKLLPASLIQLHLEENAIHGYLPPSIAELSNLTLLNLSSNFISGSIPPEISRLSKLERVCLSNNSLTGEIPVTLGEIKQLGLLDLSKNNLSGSIPATLSNLMQLRRLLLYENKISGIIPPSLGRCNNLEILDLSHNLLNGTIPREVAALRNLKLYLNLSRNYLEGPLPLELSKMEMVLAIDLSSNNFTGSVPPQLGSCIAIEYLNISHNSFLGTVPSSVGSLPYLNTLDLSSNNFSGELPESLKNLATLRLLNLSFNDFSGEVPATGVFKTLTMAAFEGNSKLCGGPIKVLLPPCNGSTQAKKHIKKSLILPILLTVSATPCVVCCFSYYLSLKRKKMGIFDGGEGDLLKVLSFPRLTQHQLAEATDGFNPSSLVGSGRFGHVYKGTLKDQTLVAVKVLDLQVTESNTKSFERECRVLKRIRHRNLIKIITACSKPDFKALVLPFMANGSLETHLYGPQGGLSLVRVVHICSDIAEGVAYLHHHAPVRVIHCDLKPSNVLLDEEMGALVADFGVARLAGSGAMGSEEVSSGSGTGLLCGSIGYIAPEYGLGRNASTEGDVYSFGILVLEMVTGRRPVDLTFQQGLTLQDWVKGHYPHNMDPIIERTVSIEDETLSSPRLRRLIAIELIELGLLCTQRTPKKRPTMMEIADELGRLKQFIAEENTTTESDVVASSS